MDNVATQILIATIAAVTGLLESIAANIKAHGGAIAKNMLKGGAVEYTVRLHTSLWADGDKAWRIEALHALATMYNDGRPEHQSFTKCFVNYRNVSATFRCETLEAQRDLLESLNVVLARTAEWK